MESTSKKKGGKGFRTKGESIEFYLSKIEPLYINAEAMLRSLKYAVGEGIVTEDDLKQWK